MGCVCGKVKIQDSCTTEKKPLLLEKRVYLLSGLGKALIRNQWHLLKIHIVEVGIITLMGLVFDLEVIVRNITKKLFYSFKLTLFSICLKGHVLVFRSI